MKEEEVEKRFPVLTGEHFDSCEREEPLSGTTYLDPRKPVTVPCSRRKLSVGNCAVIVGPPRPSALALSITHLNPSMVHS